MDGSLAENMLFYLELAIIIVGYSLSTLMMRNTLKIEFTIPKKFYWGMTSFFLSYSTCRVLYFSRYFFFVGGNLLYDLGIIAGVLAVVFFVFGIETTIF
ncbi:MAG: hypothetical protein ACFFCS_28950, partial [Candidatus Hodarchaeota archaeon]